MNQSDDTGGDGICSQKLEIIIKQYSLQSILPLVRSQAVSANIDFFLSTQVPVFYLYFAAAIFSDSVCCSTQVSDHVTVTTTQVSKNYVQENDVRATNTGTSYQL